MEVKTILCPVDLSPITRQVVDLAVQACRLFGSRLVVQHNIEVMVPPEVPLEVLPLPDFLDEQYTKQRVQEFISSVPASIPTEIRITRGLADSSILYLAREIAADLIVMGTHGRSGIKHMLIGSTTERVIARSCRPVLAVRESGAFKIIPTTDPLTSAQGREVLVPIDFSPHSLNTLEHAYRLATMLPITLHLLHVVQPISWEDMQGAGHFNVPEYQRARVLEAKERLRLLIPEEMVDRVQVHVRMGPVVKEITDLADSIRASLIVMGVTPGGLIEDLLFGAVAYGVLRGSPCPVWVVPGKRAQPASERSKDLEFSDFPHPTKP